MLKNYLKIALRHLLKRKGYSFINITGMAIGMACCILITLYLINELSYDQFHHQAGRIFRVRVTLDLNGVLYREASIPFPAAEAFLNDYPEVEQAVRLYKSYQDPLLTYDDRNFTEARFFFADRSILEVFDFPLLAGDRQTALEEPNSVVISEEMARKYFGDSDPLGKQLKYDNRYSLKVTGVAKKVPENSHFKFDFLAPLEFQLGLWESVSGIHGREKKWFWTGAWTYLLLSERQAAAALSAKLPHFVDKYFPERIKGGIQLALQPLTDIHLYSRLDNEIEPNGHILYVYIFSAIALFILLIAGINFINLSTAQFIHRAREVGIRKVLGAKKSQLIGQMLGEAVIASLLAVLMAIGVVEIWLPFFKELTGKPLEFPWFGNGIGMLLIPGLALVAGLLSGIYPAVFLAAFKPVSIFRKTIFLSPGNEMFRKALVVTQFGISIGLIIGIGIINQQLNFFQEKALGFDKQQLVFIKARPGVNQQFEVFRNELLQDPAIRGVSATSNVPGEGVFGYRFIPEGTSPDTPRMLPLLLVDYDFLETLGITVKAGRGFSRNFPADQTEAFILNETAVQNLGWQDDPVGKRIELFAPGTNEIAKTGTIIGVIQDYHFESLHHQVKPLVLTLTDDHSYYAVKLAPGNISQSLSRIENIWQKFSPDWPLEYVFLDQNLVRLYEDEQQLARVIRYFTVIAILIACLGLFGLATFAAEKRTKEIGIRKVLGASVAGIVLMLSGDFMKLVVIANIIAWPVAYGAMNAWLQNFAYQAGISWWIFPLGGILAVAVALFTVSFQALKAALANPVKTLRYE